ncbi:DUF421 domain-containing protein [Cohnella nanjingensis]|uniref:DUF421 domain-containing protein n=2 Tax=Cohnella nanjingensis TaxID=1387779 RepID=A0A7X0VHL5_9BACL|nr:DUF421 domain-containing protein [Cohnella nanjingensis]
MYFFVFLILRLMGKREIGKLSVFDMVISIMLAEIAVISIESPDRALWATLAPMALLVLIQLTISRFTLKSRRLRLWFDGQPSVIISRGHLNWEEMKRQRYSLDDLLMQLRENKVDNVGQVELAVLESSGKLSVLPRDREPASDEEASDRSENGAFSTRDRESAAGPERGDAAKEVPPDPPRVRFELLPLPLILDGEVQEENLGKAGKNLLWLKQELRQRGVKDVRQVFFCSIDHRGKLYVDRKR